MHLIYIIPQDFQRWMWTKSLKTYLKDFCVVYIDDILVFSKTMEEYKKHLKVVCEKIKNKKYVESIVL